MGKLGADIQYAIAAMGGDSDMARINLRAHQVRNRYREVIETVYRANASLFLAHTNNVYIMDKEGARTLIVYVDESIFAAELNAQRELIKLKLLEMFGETIEEFEIFVSRGRYKDNHPYLVENEDVVREKPTSVPLDSDEKSFVSNTVSLIEDDQLRGTIEKAMTADLEWKKGKSEKSSVENGNRPL